MPPIAMPQLPDNILSGFDSFAPDDDFRDWIVATFIEEGGPLVNEDHRHLQFATLGVLWTNCDNRKHLRFVIGQAEIMPPMAMGKWQRARAEAQIEEWFGSVPDFVLTFYLPAVASMSERQVCALVEHELYHCGQDRNEFGAPKFTLSGRPKFAIRGHDVEEFVGVVARYGASVSPGVGEMIEAASIAPLTSDSAIAWACGSCSTKRLTGA